MRSARVSVRRCSPGVIRPSRSRPSPPTTGRAADPPLRSTSGRGWSASTCPGGRGTGPSRIRVVAAGTGTTRRARSGSRSISAGGATGGGAPGRRAGRSRRAVRCRFPVPAGRSSIGGGGWKTRPGTSEAAGRSLYGTILLRVHHRAGTVVRRRPVPRCGRPGWKVRSGRLDSPRKCPGSRPGCDISGVPRENRPDGAGTRRTGPGHGRPIRSGRPGILERGTGRTGSRRCRRIRGMPRVSTAGTGRWLPGVAGGRTAATGGRSSPTLGSGRAASPGGGTVSRGPGPRRSHPRASGPVPGSPATTPGGWGRRSPRPGPRRCPHGPGRVRRRSIVPPPHRCRRVRR
ncbi:hypothetical protein GA0074694_1333 [Micromonospora inyonensis]|uniref:Uncharacterized protein n=1 Tax=Micromonospora inyonensis TaxID=47866 RepID=A0A1C6REX5_9ACTN|nr:hypothetical protein GA0074694_1333 [Micromonospora inyonensis]